jgi:hypothetical protein
LLEQEINLFTNQAIDINTLSRRVFAHGKASKRRCSTPTTSFDNAVCRPVRCGLSIKINLLGASRMPLLWVVTLDKGTTIACESRLDQGHS